MEARCLLFLTDEMEPIVTAYISEILQMHKPVILELFFDLPDDLKKAKEPVIIVTQKELADDLEDLGSLHEAVKENRKAGIIVLPDVAFAAIVEAEGRKQITVKNDMVEQQLKKSISVIMDESMPKHCIFLIGK